MSVRHRSRLAAATGMAALTLAAAGAAVLPAQTASAAPLQSLALTVGNPVGHSPLLPGGKAETFTVTVKNNSSKAVDFTGGFYAVGQGVQALTDSAVTLSATPIHAPATATHVSATAVLVDGWFSTKTGGAFSVPAHAYYSWKFSVAATKAWPLNDNSLQLAFSGLSKVLDFKVGTTRTGGPLTAALSGSDYLSPTHPMVETLTLTNHTGAALRGPIRQYLSLSSTGNDSRTLADTDIRLQTWDNGHWVPWTDNNLPELKNGLANGASANISVRFQLLRQTMPTSSGHIALHIDGSVNGAYPPGGGTFDLTKVFAVYR